MFVPIIMPHSSIALLPFLIACIRGYVGLENNLPSSAQGVHYSLKPRVTCVHAPY
jgi:hypothetical protein